MIFIFILKHFRGVKPGTIIADSSTIDPDVSKEMAVASNEKGARFLDAPVSGGKPLKCSYTINHTFIFISYVIFTSVSTKFNIN